ncbi:Fructosamine/Ketosamine-3-kinase [Tricladium varicosporioides]|nr:Fructosamine/Ketosamine-3-kinase [Hymenoscyphus varicosporioides]
MPPKVDPAILSALSLDATTSTITSHGGSGFASTFKITSKGNDDIEKLFFVKTRKGKESELMFTGEYNSLNAIHTTVPSLCPKPYAHGTLTNTSGSFLATDFLNLSSYSPSTPGSGLSLAEKLVKLHSMPAPIPEGYSKPVFGFPVPTCCGDTAQDNSFKETWAEFYAENRLKGILKSAEKNHGPDSELSKLVNTTTEKVVPRLLRNGHLKDGGTGQDIVPVTVHGDLWSGNHGRGSIGEGGVEEVIFDPSSCWAHSEFEFGIMRMFGGFGKNFEREYHKLKPKDGPVEEWEDRVALYELYHHLNHYSIFGGSYRGGAVRIMENLIKKYGDE